MARLSQITGLLLDIHGQHEHQSLLYKSKHLEILDAYVKAATQPVKQTIADRYRIYRSLEEKLRGLIWMLKAVSGRLISSGLR